VVLADAGYGDASEFRSGLLSRGLDRRPRIPRAPQSAFPPRAPPNGLCRWFGASFSTCSSRSWATVHSAGRPSVLARLLGAPPGCDGSDRVVLEA
jgi:hypothetical protein